MSLVAQRPSFWIEFGSRLGKALLPLAWRYVSKRMPPKEEAAPRIVPQLERLTEEQADELRVRLLICRSYALVVDGYGSYERGLIGLYGKLGPEN